MGISRDVRLRLFYTERIVLLTLSLGALKSFSQHLCEEGFALSE